MPSADTCLSCAIVRGERDTLGGPILDTPAFHAHQDAMYPVPGLVILASKRHVKCLDELTPDEGIEFIELARRIRAAQRSVLGIGRVYFFYNEDTTHHFHLWMVPRYEWMNAFGKSVESLRPALVHARQDRNSPKDLAIVVRSVEVLRNALAQPSACGT